MSDITKYQKKLPTINELYTTDLEILDKQNSVNILLNQEPKKEWIKDHPIAKNVKYLPIERVEWLLTNIFIKWRPEVLREGILANSAYCTVRLHYKDPITGEWDWVDGVGAAPLQTDKGAGATDWTQIKSDAVMKGLPAAKSFAIKDAAETLGKLFGKDLNRKDDIGYGTLIGKFDQQDKSVLLIDLIDKLKDAGLKNLYKADCQKAKAEGKYTPEFIEKMITKVQNDL